MKEVENFLKKPLTYTTFETGKPSVLPKSFLQKSNDAGLRQALSSQEVTNTTKGAVLPNVASKKGKTF